MKDYTDSVISSRAFAELGLFNVKAVQKEYDRYVREGGENSFYIWQWLNSGALVRALYRARA